MVPVAHLLNEQPHPRVLVWLNSTAHSSDEKVKQGVLHDLIVLATTDQPGTYRFIGDLNEIDPTEWDAIITDQDTVTQVVNRSSADGHPGPKSGRRIVPEHLFVFRIVHPPRPGHNLLDVVPSVKNNERRLLSASAPGSHVRGGTIQRTAPLDDLRDALLAITELRSHQFGVAWRAPSDDDDTEPVVEPLALGPTDMMLAGRYQRVDGAGVWFVPADLRDFDPWWEAALRDWHTMAPDRFPDFPGWDEDYAWLSYAEQQTADAITAERESFAAAQTAHAARVHELKTALADSNNGLKVLLTGSGTELQNAVRDVLSDFGYDVEDMDSSGQFDEREQREDYRIREPGIVAWLAIGDATGVAKGAKASKLLALARYAAHFVREEEPGFVPRQWLLVNRELDKEPTQRSEHIYRDDELAGFAAAPGLAIDTPALFVLHRAMQRGPVTGQQIRDWLRERVGELTLRDADGLLDSLRSQ